MTKLEEAQRTYDKSNKLLRIGVITFLIYVGVLLTTAVVTNFLVYNTIAANQNTNAQGSADRFARYTKENEDLHRQTQQYVRCIAQVLLLPIDQRTNTAFDSCSVTGTYNGKSSGSTSEPTTNNNGASSNVVKTDTGTKTTPAVVSPPSSTNPPITQPTPTAPPDPSFLDKLPLIGGAFKALGL